MRAIVLSGGGARGAYQIGAWRAFRKLGINFDIVTGTSVGAFNGALMVQNDFKKAFKIWKNMNFGFVFSDEIDFDDKKELFNLYTKNFIKNGGMNVDSLENNVTKYLNYKKFMKSRMDYGMVTYNLTTKKEIKVLKKEIDSDNFADFLMASATCYPAFPKKIIDGNKYIDGGFVNNVPLDVAISLGAKKIIVINLGSVGIEKNIKTKDIEVRIIKPRNQLDSFLLFDKNSSTRMMKLGYNDILKEYGRLDGFKYSFKKNVVRKMYNRYSNKINDQCIKLFGNISYSGLKQNINSKDSFLKTIEFGADAFQLKDYEVYSRVSFNNHLKKEFLKTVKINPKDSISNNKKIIKAKMIKHIYKLIEEGKDDEVKRLSLIFKKESVLALYLHII